jgi:hypothetical protein
MLTKDELLKAISDLKQQHDVLYTELVKSEGAIQAMEALLKLMELNEVTAKENVPDEA